MFSSIGWGEILVILVVGLFVLGPERLPEAMAWLGRGVRKVREFANGAREQLRRDLGPDFEEFRKPLAELNELRNFHPKRAVRQHLFDGDSDPLGLRELDRADGRSTRSPAVSGSNGGSRGVAQSLEQGERPPVDPDAT
ncbi:Sec-independent protein translocase protein TatB [Haloechinothrix sp. LS1_15]|uniref:Sec-independent protein translocase protein TatB n=1 Tax=Haloechinothrix sp. LS1_15 TaxID=2652248 RepID=UPI002947DD1A|nr:Sec-independent protein translocase protein TatB [Haloechinothrix sp. LS1_15]MDV6013891.1 Sec-independent protein translocase subunit TatB [Haloechinothrix sp. LS1_15]